MSDNMVTIHITNSKTMEKNKSEFCGQKNKSWVVLTYEAEEEERLEREEEEREKYKKLADERKYLISVDMYELEDGEILD